MNHMQFRADSGLAPSQWETPLQSNTVSHWLGANLESALKVYVRLHINHWLLYQPGGYSYHHMAYLVSSSARHPMNMVCGLLIIIRKMRVTLKDDVMPWEHLPYHWPFVMGIHHRSPRASADAGFYWRLCCKPDRPLNKKFRFPWFEVT